MNCLKGKFSTGNPQKLTKKTDGKKNELNGILWTCRNREKKNHHMKKSCPVDFSIHFIPLIFDDFDFGTDLPDAHAPRHESRCCPCHRHVSQCQRPSSHLLRHLQGSPSKNHGNLHESKTKKRSTRSGSLQKPVTRFACDIFAKEGSILRSEVSTCRHLRCLLAGRSVQSQNVEYHVVSEYRSISCRSMKNDIRL